MTEDATLGLDQGQCLTVLCRAPADELKRFTNSVLPRLPQVEVLSNRTGLVMAPFTDSSHGKVFHLGEVLVAEGRVRLDGVEGYGACTGRDLEQALAVAILDAALQAGIEAAAIQAFVRQQAAVQAQEDELLMRQVETTRVEMETF